jgi:uncharacterized protein YutE (UPF0331/DUF86 family)
MDSRYSDSTYVDPSVIYLRGGCGHVNYHLLTGAGQPPPSDYFASFVRLGDIGALDAVFARSIARSAGLRNRLVHDYEELDAAQVFAALGDAQKDIPRYLEQINRYLESTGGSEAV